MKCINCKSEISDSAKFCNQCGYHFGDDYKCPNCGHINSASTKFCGECGTVLGALSKQQNTSSENSSEHSRSIKVSAQSTGDRLHNEVKPPYLYAIICIIAGLFTVTIVPSIIGIFMLMKCNEASKANNRGDYEEAERLAHQAIWNPLGMSPALQWIIGIIAVVGIVVLISIISS